MYPREGFPSQSPPREISQGQDAGGGGGGGGSGGGQWEPVCLLFLPQLITPPRCRQDCAVLRG